MFEYLASHKHYLPSMTSMSTCILCDGKGEKEVPDCNAPHDKCPACQDLLEADKEIEHITAQLIMAQSKRAKILSKVNDAHDTIINRLPRELFVEILKNALPTMQVAWKKIPGVPRNGPHIFAAVSTHWRDLIHGTPTLWTEIPAVLVPIQDPRPLKAMLDTWLERSGAMKLSIALRIERAGEPSFRAKHGDTIVAIMHRINAVSHRLAHFSAKGPQYYLRHLSFGSGASNIRSLEYLDYNSVNDALQTGVDGNQRANLGTGTAPLFLKISHCLPSDIHVSVSHLTHAHLKHLPVSACLKLISDAPRLQSLTLHECSNDLLHLAENSRIAICESQLHTLQISGRPQNPITCTMLGVLRLPQLKTIFLTEDTYIPIHTSVVDCLLKLLNRSVPPLESLTMKHLGSSSPTSQEQGTFHELLSKITHLVQPTLQQLTVQIRESTLNHCILPQDFINSLIVPGSNVRSVTVSGGLYLWSHLLLHLVRAIDAVTTNTPGPSIVMFLDTWHITNARDAVRYSCFGDAKVARTITLNEDDYRQSTPGEEISAPKITALEVEEMLSLIDTRMISVKVSRAHMCDWGTDINRDANMFEEIRSSLASII